MSVLVVGAGTMGRWIADHFDDPVTFTDTDPAVADAATSDREDATQIEPSSVNESAFDVVVVAVPMPVAPDAIETYAETATEAIVDVTGEMAAPIDAMREHAQGLERVSLHPLFAPANAPGTVAAVHDATGPATEDLRASLTATGNDVFETTVEEHDDAMASVQAATHTAILAWRLATEDVPDAFHTPLSSTLDDLATHVTNQDGRVYADIATRYPDGREELAAAATDLANAEREAFIDAFETARDTAMTDPSTDESRTEDD